MRDHLEELTCNNYKPLRETKFSRSCEVATPRTNFRLLSVTSEALAATSSSRLLNAPRANTVALRNSSSSERGVMGVIRVYGSFEERLNLVMYWMTLSSWRSR